MIITAASMVRRASAMTRPIVFVSLFGAFIAAGQAQAAPIYADTFITQGSPVTDFGSGNVLGAPDGGGKFLGNPPLNSSFITVAFLGVNIYDGPGVDLRVIDIEGFPTDPGETADVLVSTDNVTYFLAGSIIGGDLEGSVDVGGVLGINPIKYVRIVQTSTADALDVDAIEAFHESSNEVPEPASIALLGTGLLGLCFGRSRRRR